MFQSDRYEGEERAFEAANQIMNEPDRLSVREIAEMPTIPTVGGWIETERKRPTKRKRRAVA